MRRQPIRGGSWFDRDKAVRWEEGSDWDGNNWISVATGSQWEHEALYKTRMGMWVLRRWSEWQGTRSSWRAIDESRAAAWLVKNGHGDDQVLAAKVSELEV
jgi:hypothetical protein